MLKFYLTTIVIWMIIIWCTTVMFKEALLKKIKVDETKKSTLTKKLTTLFVLSAVPILRLLIEAMLIYIAVCKREDFDTLMEQVNNKS